MAAPFSCRHQPLLGLRFFGCSHGDRNVLFLSLPSFACSLTKETDKNRKSFLQAAALADLRLDIWQQNALQSDAHTPSPTATCSLMYQHFFLGRVGGEGWGESYWILAFCHHRLSGAIHQIISIKSPPPIYKTQRGVFKHFNPFMLMTPSAFTFANGTEQKGGEAKYDWPSRRDKEKAC